MAPQNLDQQILRMGALAERILGLAQRALVERRVEPVMEVRREDLAIDRLDVEIDEEILRALALRAPVAKDLRRVFAIKAMAIDLERVGDLARNIAGSAQRLMELPETTLPARLEPLHREAAQLLRMALDAFQAWDPDAARGVIARDDRVDALHAEAVKDLTAAMERHPDWIPQAVESILISHSLERVGDHATNIAEDVILVVEARNVKHAEKLA